MAIVSHSSESGGGRSRTAPRARRSGGGGGETARSGSGETADRWAATGDIGLVWTCCAGVLSGGEIDMLSSALVIELEEIEWRRGRGSAGACG